MTDDRTQFDYPLNALLHAAQSDKPAEHGYRDKTLALFAYVRDLERDAARYRWLSAWPDRPTDYITTGLPWVVHIEQEHGVPTMKAIAHEALDAAIDAALRAAASIGQERK